MSTSKRLGAIRTEVEYLFRDNKINKHSLEKCAANHMDIDLDYMLYIHGHVS
jgi:hypothetical protein